MAVELVTGQLPTPGKEGAVRFANTIPAETFRAVDAAGFFTGRWALHSDSTGNGLLKWLAKSHREFRNLSSLQLRKFRDAYVLELFTGADTRVDPGWISGCFGPNGSGSWKLVPQFPITLP